MSDESESPDPQPDPGVEREAPAEEGVTEGVVVRLEDIIKQANENKRSIDALVQDSKPWAQLHPTKDLASSISGMFSSWQAQNSELLSAIAPMDAVRASMTGHLGLSKSVAELIGRQNQQVARSFFNAFGAISEARRSIGALEGILNRPGFATGTQRFLATTEDLRYGSGRTVWHYTSGYVLMQVLSKDYLWASIPHNLNDSSEVKHGLDIIRRAFDQGLAELARNPKYVDKGLDSFRQAVDRIFNERFLNEVLNEIYIISASASQDSLTLWRNYSGGDGFAIGIRSGVTLSADGISESPEANQADARDAVPPIRGWYKVAYGEKQKRHLAQHFAANALEDMKKALPSNRSQLLREQRKHILILASTMKHIAFKDENEVRWITTNWMPVEVMPRGSVVHYEHTPQGIVPVLHVRTASEDEAKPLPIKGIRCSPASREGVERTIRGLLVDRGYKAASKDVRQSKQPYKG
ncbi:DUF2971 domain-containing protein [Arthrobacter sp. TMS1-12-1]